MPPVYPDCGPASKPGACGGAVRDFKRQLNPRQRRKSAGGRARGTRLDQSPHMPCVCLAARARRSLRRRNTSTIGIVNIKPLRISFRPSHARSVVPCWRQAPPETA